MAIKEKDLPLGATPATGSYIRTVSENGASQKTDFDAVKEAITSDEAEAREAADTQLQTEIDDKVDKVTGKGLSTNDFTDALKTKLDGIEAGAEVNPTIDDALSDSSENPVQNKIITGVVNGIQDELSDKPNWTVGSAEQLVSDEASQTDTTPYTFRRSGGGLIPFNFTREELSKVVGGTVAWNQLCNSSSVTVPNGHKYYMLKGGTASVGASTGSAITGLTSGTDMVIDLTAMFGTTIADYIYSLETATAGSGIAKLREWGFFTDSYYAYDAGSLQSVCVGAHKTRGFNQWDEIWEAGTISTSTGQNQTGNSSIRSKNYIPVIPGGEYWFRKSTPPTTVGVYYYDANKNFLQRVSITFSYTVRTIPSNAYYMRIAYADTEYRNDICINLSKTSGSPKNGDYVPYDGHTYALDDVTLRGIPKLDANNNLYCDGDEYGADGTVTRKYIESDFGDRSWTYDSTDNYFKSTASDMVDGGSSSINLICSQYEYKGRGSASTMASAANMTIYTYGQQLRVKNTSYTDADAFKTAMAGVKVVYAASSPTTETADPYTAVQICDSDGTEAFTDALVEAGDRDVAIPAGHETVYFEDMAGKLADLPPIPDAPSENGTYTLQAVVSSGNVTYQWTS